MSLTKLKKNWKIIKIQRIKKKLLTLLNVCIYLLNLLIFCIYDLFNTVRLLTEKLTEVNKLNGIIKINWLINYSFMRKYKKILAKNLLGIYDLWKTILVSFKCERKWVWWPKKIKKFKKLGNF